MKPNLGILTEDDDSSDEDFVIGDPGSASMTDMKRVISGSPKEQIQGLPRVDSPDLIVASPSLRNVNYMVFVLFSLFFFWGMFRVDVMNVCVCFFFIFDRWQ